MFKKEIKVIAEFLVLRLRESTIRLSSTTGGSLGGYLFWISDLRDCCIPDYLLSIREREILGGVRRYLG